jgi:hypothetical protein
VTPPPIVPALRALFFRIMLLTPICILSLQ